MSLRVISDPDPKTRIVFETPHEQAVRPDEVVIAVEPDDPTDQSGPHRCASCGQPLISGPIEGRLPAGIVIQCPACRAFNEIA